MRSDPKQTKDDRDVAALIRAVRPRTTVPRERAERVREAAHSTWVREARRSARRRRLVAAAGLAVAASLIVALGPRLLTNVGRGHEAPAAALVASRVESLSGMAWAVPYGQASEPETGSLAVGDRIAPDAEIRTADAARLALRLPSGHSLRLDHASRLRVLAGGSVFLEAGAVYVDSRDARTATEAAAEGRPGGAAVAAVDALTVRTPFGTIEEIGTQFEVRLAPDAVRVRLREGKVIVHHAAAAYPVAVGTEFSLALDGSTATQLVPAHDARWDWVATVAPPFDLEGRTARSFLDWVARERGLRLVFADARLARSAGEIILAGKLQGSSLDQALDMVLPTCRMSHRVVDGLLLVDAAPTRAGRQDR